MDKYFAAKAGSIVITAVLVANLVLLGLKRVSPLFFWVNIILGFAGLQVIKMVKT